MQVLSTSKWTLRGFEDGHGWNWRCSAGRTPALEYQDNCFKHRYVPPFLPRFWVETDLHTSGKVDTGFFETMTSSMNANVKEALEKVEKKQSRLNKEVISKYKEAEEQVIRNQENLSASPTLWVSQAIEAALLDSDPLARYIVGREANIVIPLFLLLPESLSDLFLNIWKKK